MKALKSISALLLLSMLAVGVTSCSDGGSGDDNKNSTNASSGTNQSGDNSGSTEGKKDNAGKDTSGTNNDGENSGESTSATTPKVTLPESVGENPFAGKTFTLEGSSSEKMRTWNFTNDTATEIYARTKKGETKTETSVYRYSYDANQKLLFLSFKSYSEKSADRTYTFSSVAEYEEILRKDWGYSGEALEEILAMCASQFDTMEVYQYEISENSIILTKYFNGSLPTVVHFSTESETPIYIDYNDAKGMIYIKLSDNTLYEFYPTFSNNSFSGKMYKGLWDGDKENRTSVGTVEGTYTTSGKGIKGSGCTITLIFTKLPDSVTGFTTGTEYVLKN